MSDTKAIMPLPLCVKINSTDGVSMAALEDEGWRCVGDLWTFKGVPKCECKQDVRILANADVLPLAKQIKWRGRLWRDPEITDEQAWEETERFLLGTEAIVYGVGSGPAAFGVFERQRILLIGVHPAAGRLGCAASIVNWAIRGGEMTSGTYSDNNAAVAFYKSIGMEIVQKQSVYHKAQTTG